jgi:hypothetical protein
MISRQEREGGTGKDPQGCQARKERRNENRYSGRISRQEREGGKGIDTLGWSRGKKRKEEWA